jgi:ArsR family transcriptional regulator, arsenate/arsenite/antimonite-responsive transcriptional repressor
MRTQDAVQKLSALSHEARLKLFRRLIQAGDEGMSAGSLADFAGSAAPTVSAQLLVLLNADLVYSQRNGRQIIYYANYAQMSELMTFMLEDCCCGAQDICQPLAAVMNS